MGVRGSVVLFASPVIVVTMAGVLQAQRQFTQSPATPRFEISPPQRPGQPLFPVQPFEVPRAPQLPAPVPALPPVPPDTLANLRPRVVCGMTLIPAPPSVDPKIAEKRESQKPKNPTTYMIRPVQPSMCW